MTATAPVEPLVEAVPAPEQRSKLGWGIRDSAAVAGRYLKGYFRQPQMLTFNLIQPIMFVLLFRYVFGGAIQVPGGSYVDYLMPGIWVQTTVFGATGTGIGLAEDLHKGLIERFRSLPMARSAVLVGRTWADVCRNVVVLIVMATVGFLVGFRIHEGVAAFVLALALILLFGYAFSWVTAIVGLSMPTSEAAQAAIFPILFPLTFASSAFVPVETMPGWLQAFATWQPVTIVVNAARGLTAGPEAVGIGVTSSDVWVYVAGAVAWSLGIIAVFAPLAVRKFRRSV